MVLASNSKLLIRIQHIIVVESENREYVVMYFLILNYQCSCGLTGTTILAAVENTVDQHTEVVHSEYPETQFLKSNKFSFAIVVVGELPYCESFGDDKKKELQMNSFQICGLWKKSTITISGRPLVIEPYLPKIDALVAAWLPGTEGQGVADVLLGDYGFTGRLAGTWFKTVDQLPMNVGDAHYDPPFQFGYGLTTLSAELRSSE
ncbi:unnamed protein product [Coffea canephora]|uniref:beta-glucosidase n=1 Tax=Coffea canephora TaxID=49390 RepID=A0A068V4C0_COFCA|nr:unnamed protein product [Coffea canephora]